MFKGVDLNPQMENILKDAFFAGTNILFRRLTNNPNNQVELGLVMESTQRDLKEYIQEVEDKHTTEILNCIPEGSSVN